MRARARAHPAEGCYRRAVRTRPDAGPRARGRASALLRSSLAASLCACTPLERPLDERARVVAARTDEPATPREAALDERRYAALMEAMATRLAERADAALARPIDTREQAYAASSTLALAHPAQAMEAEALLKEHGVTRAQLAEFVERHPERAQFHAARAYAALDRLRPKIDAWEARVATLPGAERPTPLWSPAALPPWPEPPGRWPPWP